MFSLTVYKLTQKVESFYSQLSFPVNSIDFFLSHLL